MTANQRNDVWIVDVEDAKGIVDKVCDPESLQLIEAYRSIRSANVREKIRSMIAEIANSSPGSDPQAVPFDEQGKRAKGQARRTAKSAAP